ncbi:MAG: hypothetical protein J0L94_12175 [Rhodothermia bacterium]|nr:hypothetical protein [Rhodothermia bacterium]
MMSPLRGWVVRLGAVFYDDATPMGLGFVMAKAICAGRSTQPHAEAWG